MTCHLRDVGFVYSLFDNDFFSLQPFSNVGIEAEAWKRALGSWQLEGKGCMENCQKSTAQVPGQELRILGEQVI